MTMNESVKKEGKKRKRREENEENEKDENKNFKTSQWARDLKFGP